MPAGRGDRHPVIVALDCAILEETRRHDATLRELDELRARALDVLTDEGPPAAPAPAGREPPSRTRRSRDESIREVKGVLESLAAGERITIQSVSARTGLSDYVARQTLKHLEAKGEAHSETDPEGNGRQLLWVGTAPLHPVPDPPDAEPEDEPPPQIHPPAPPSPARPPEPAPAASAAQNGSTRSVAPEEEEMELPPEDDEDEDDDGPSRRVIKRQIKELLSSGRKYGGSGIAQALELPHAEVMEVLSDLIVDGEVEMFGPDRMYELAS